MLTAAIYFIIALVHMIAIYRPDQVAKTRLVMVILYISLAGAYVPLPIAIV